MKEIILLGLSYCRTAEVSAYGSNTTMFLKISDLKADSEV